MPTETDQRKWWALFVGCGCMMLAIMLLSLGSYGSDMEHHVLQTLGAMFIPPAILGLFIALIYAVDS